MESISCHIMPLIINSLGSIHIDKTSFIHAHIPTSQTTIEVGNWHMPGFCVSLFFKDRKQDGDQALTSIDLN